MGLNPDVILASGAPALKAMQQATRTIPIVFLQISDPTGEGYVASMAHPGGNATGFATFEFAMAGKWLELLKLVAPRLTRTAVVLDRSASAGLAQLGAIQAVAPTFGMTVTLAGIRDAAELTPQSMRSPKSRAV